jgi:DNA-binding NarL/FixJ family response regulator
MRAMMRCIGLKKRWNVLIVEDDALVAWSIDEVLSLLGFEVVGVATNVGDALRIAEEARPDLAIFDVRLSGRRDGIEGAALLRDRLGLPSVFVAAREDKAARQRVAKAGAAGCVDKPVHYKQLVSVVEGALAEQD